MGGFAGPDFVEGLASRSFAARLWLRGGWTAVASRRLRGGFAEASRQRSIVSRNPGLKRTVLFRSSSCSLVVAF